MDSKNCTTCKKLKPLAAFGKNSAKHDGLNHNCKACCKIRNNTHSKTKIGMTKITFFNQCNSSKTRNHPAPNYTLNEFREWAYSQPVFHKLYDNWLHSGYKKELKPSFDRKDDYKPYVLDNLTVMTWDENNKKGFADRINGVNNKINKAVVQMKLDGTFIADYYSISEAGRRTSVNQSNITACCTRKLKQSGRYRFMHSLNIPIVNNLKGNYT